MRPGDMLQCGQFLRGEDSGIQSVVGHDTGIQKGLQIAGNMYVDAQIRYLNNKHWHYERQRYIYIYRAEPRLVGAGEDTEERSSEEEESDGDWGRVAIGGGGDGCACITFPRRPSL